MLENEISQDLFQSQCQAKLDSLLPLLQSEEGKEALKNHTAHLNFLAGYELGLYLLSLFKKYQLSNYSVLDTVAKIVNSLNRTELYDFKALVSQVIVEQQIFDQLGEMIGIPKNKKSPEAYAQM